MFYVLVGILSYIFSSELIRQFCEIFNVTFGVPNAIEGEREKREIDGGGRDQCNFSGVQLAQQFMKLNSFIVWPWNPNTNRNNM